MRQVRKRMQEGANKAYGRVRPRPEKLPPVTPEPDHVALLDDFTWPGKDYCNEVKEAFVQDDFSSPYDGRFSGQRHFKDHLQNHSRG